MHLVVIVITNETKIELQNKIDNKVYLEKSWQQEFDKSHQLRIGRGERKFGSINFQTVR